MSKYADMVRDFEAWDDGEMNTAEAAYYLDVQTRVSKKLLEVAEQNNWKGKNYAVDEREQEKNFRK